MNKLALKRSGAKAQRSEKNKEKNPIYGRSNSKKHLKKSRQKHRKSSYANLCRDYAEYEVSRPELSNNTLQKVTSDESVIFVKTYKLNQGYPVIDLTDNTNNYFNKERKYYLKQSDSLKTIYKADNTMYKRVSTNSLLSLLPALAQKLNTAKRITSAPRMGNVRKNKLEILNIPAKYNNNEGNDGISNMDLGLAELNKYDRNMIEEILDMETDMQARLCCSETNFTPQNRLFHTLKNEIPRLNFSSSSDDTLL